MREELRRQGFDGEHVTTERLLNMRFEGTDTALMVLPSEQDGDGQEDFEAAFKRVYKTEFGFLLETKTIIVDDIKVCDRAEGLGYALLTIAGLGPRDWQDFRHSRRVGI